MAQTPSPTRCRYIAYRHTARSPTKHRAQSSCPTLFSQSDTFPHCCDGFCSVNVTSSQLSSDPVRRKAHFPHPLQQACHPRDPSDIPGNTTTFVKTETLCLRFQSPSPSKTIKQRRLAPSYGKQKRSMELGNRIRWVRERQFPRPSDAAYNVCTHCRTTWRPLL